MGVLLIDDHEEVRTTVADALMDQDIEVDGVANAADALVLLGSGQIPDVLVTDINLGAGLDGMDLADMARTKHPDVEIIFISAVPGNASGRRLGQHERFVRKPFTAEQLVDAIRDAAGLTPRA
jgi:CheY-like chemotaxis protein